MNFADIHRQVLRHLLVKNPQLTIDRGHGGAVSIVVVQYSIRILQIKLLAQHLAIFSDLVFGGIDMSGSIFEFGLPPQILLN